MREPESVFAGFDRGGVGELNYFVMPGLARHLFEGSIRTNKITFCIDSGSAAGMSERALYPIYYSYPDRMHQATKIIQRLRIRVIRPIFDQIVQFDNFCDLTPFPEPARFNSLQKSPGIL